MIKLEFKWKLLHFVTFSGVPSDVYAFSGVPAELTGVSTEYWKFRP